MKFHSLVACLSLLVVVGVSHGLPAVVTAPPQVAAQCPYTPGPIPLLLPNPVDCGSFYMCSWYGTALLQHCPPVLHFNAKLQVCDSPEHANCAQKTTTAPVSSTTTAVPVSNVTTAVPVSNVTTAVPVSNVTTAVPVSNVTTAVPVANVTTAAPASNITSAVPVNRAATAGVSHGLPAVVTAPPQVAAQCPYTPGPIPLLLPNPVDCGSFYMCSWYGTALLQHCPPVLHFNAKLQVCDSPEHANCVQRTTAAHVSSTTTSAPVSNATTAIPVSNITTVVPVSNVTTAVPIFNGTTAVPSPL
ncbi:putative mucin-2-like isoform X2 [Penaeus vannamei]|uniref:Putative mucin-2-like isoform X2 n=1 Tax=Penaeus vannamei TaxID=6689 RepID=A0A3R7M6C1_PENVA|nr:flocculation protein FLO11-like [Penaeus vannamei]ROT73201.1 putative mucin-2-like isoform X2 [Penaeus vannamei]